LAQGKGLFNLVPPEGLHAAGHRQHVPLDGRPLLVILCGKKLNELI
jgi:hypothetical protein